MTAVFGWFFGELLCKEVKDSGALVSALVPAFKKLVTDVDDTSRLSIDRSIFSSFNPSNPNSDKNRQWGTVQRLPASPSHFPATSPGRGRCGLSRNIFSKRFSFLLFCFAKKVDKKGAPKTMTAVFGWFFGERLCIEVNSSGVLFSALDLAFKKLLTDVDDTSRLSIDRSIFSSFNPPNPNSDNKR